MKPLDHCAHAGLAMLIAGAALNQKLGEDAPTFLTEYADELRARTQWSGDAQGWHETLWRNASAAPNLPLTRLAAAGAGRLGIDLLALAGLAAEDGRIAALLGHDGFCAVGTLVALHRQAFGEDRPEAVRASIAWLVNGGLLTETNPTAPHHAREVTVTQAAWSLLMGGAPLAGAGERVHLADLVLCNPVRQSAKSAMRLLATEPVTVLWLRGPQDNGRKTLARALAGEIGCAVVTVADKPEAIREGALTAFLHDAILIVMSENGAVSLPDMPLAPVRTIVVSPRLAALDTSGRPVVSLDLPLPGLTERTALWRRAAPDTTPTMHEDLAGAFRVTSGALLRAGAAAGHAPPLSRDAVRHALRDLLDGRLEAVASRVETDGAREFLALPDGAHAELDTLVLRCRHREQLAWHVGAGNGAIGVRALLAGPSGSGKTLAARWLARRLGKDLWRIDLSAAVSKYIGETEKTLERAFAAAEERDIVLLLDEGDALMARRTDVGNATDRYANLETNFLLQRMESFAGVLVVTTNAADRIDPAFQRRMDCVVHFAQADELARYEILLHHLGDHAVGEDLLQEVAVRCALSGGQLRNIALHARLLTLDAGGILSDRELRRAVEREYHKGDGFCPLRPLLSVVN